MGIGTINDVIVADEGMRDLEGIASKVIDSSAITFSGSSIASDAIVGTVVGNLSISAAYTGTPEWRLVNDEHGKFSVNSSTGVVTVAGDLSALGSASIKVQVKGISPKIFSPTFDLVVSGGGGGGSSPWILAGGVWNDSGVWDDASNWIDA